MEIVRRFLTPKRVAASVCLAGAAVAAFGVALIYLPAGVIVAGVCLAAFGFLCVDVDRKQERPRG